MSRSRWLLVAGWCAAALVLGVGRPAQAQGKVRAIVTFRAEVDGDVYTENVVREVGGAPIKHLPLVHGVVAGLTPAQALALRRRGDVEMVEEDARVWAVDAVYPSLVQVQAGAQIIPWGISWISAPLAWGLRDVGAGVKVGVLDSGIDLTHPDLAPVAGGFNCMYPGLSYDDNNGHGSHVSGTIAGRRNTVGVIGVAPGARLFAVKALDATGSGYVSDLITGLTWCINNGMQVVNMSLGLSQDMKSFHTALTQAYNAGIVLVAAAGNTSGPTIYPAAYPQCISVSATDQKSNALAYFSSYGKVDLAAPGVNIKSCWLNGGYVVESGTSMSTAHVTGVVALHLMKYPGLTPAQVLADLQAEATPLGSPADFGAGEVNAYKAAQ